MKKFLIACYFGALALCGGCLPAHHAPSSDGQIWTSLPLTAWVGFPAIEQIRGGAIALAPDAEIFFEVSARRGMGVCGISSRLHNQPGAVINLGLWTRGEGAISEAFGQDIACGGEAYLHKQVLQDFMVPETHAPMIRLWNTSSDETVTIERVSICEKPAVDWFGPVPEQV